MAYTSQLFGSLDWTSLNHTFLYSDNNLGQKGAGDEDFHEHGDDQLEDEEDDGSRAFLCDASETITDGCLGLQREEKGCCEGLHLHHTGCVVGRRIKLWKENDISSRLR